MSAPKRASYGRRQAHAAGESWRKWGAPAGPGTDPDQVQLPETADAPTRRRRRRLSRGQRAALAGGLYAATVAFALIPIGLRGTPAFVAGLGWAVVLYLVWRWAVTLDA